MVVLVGRLRSEDGHELYTQFEGSRGQQEPSSERLLSVATWFLTGPSLSDQI